MTKSNFLRTTCLLFTLLLLTVGCDTDGDLMMDETIEQQRNVLPRSRGMATDGACKTLAENMNTVQAYVAEVKRDDYSPSKRELANFVYDMNVQNGLIESNYKTRTIFANVLCSNFLAGDSERIITNLYERQIISKALSEILQLFRKRFSEAGNPDHAFEVIQDLLASEYYRSLAHEEKYIFEKAMNAAESGVCYFMTDGGEAMNFQDHCPECTSKQNSTKTITVVAITVAVGLQEVSSYESSTELSSILTSGIWTLNYFSMPQRVSGPCPEGLEPYCEMGFNLNLDDGLCEMLDGLEGAILSTSNCIWVDKLPNGDCPVGTISIPGASQCLLVCFGEELPDGLGQNEAGQFIYPIECRKPCTELSTAISGEGYLCVNEEGTYCVPEEYSVIWTGHPDINGSTDNCISLSYDAAGIGYIYANVQLEHCTFFLSKKIEVGSPNILDNLTVEIAPCRDIIYISGIPNDIEYDWSNFSFSYISSPHVSISGNNDGYVTIRNPLQPGQEFCFQVQATNDCGTSYLPCEVCYTIPSCKDAEGRIAVVPNNTCNSQSQCPEGYECNDGLCCEEDVIQGDMCIDDSHCPPGFECVFGNCCHILTGNCL